MIFLEVARRGSLAAAARALGWTQPAVSQQVHRLERELGLPLIARSGRGVVLTAPGRLLLRYAESVAGQLATADRAMSDLAGLRHGRVRVAAFPSACATFVAAAMAGVAGAHPGIDVRLTQVEPDDAAALLAQGDCDVAVAFEYPARQETAAATEVERVFLLRDPLFAVLPPGHPCADRAEISLADLAGDRWIAGCQRCRRQLTDEAARAGFAPDIRHSTDDYVVVQSLVSAGMAVAVLPGLALTASQHPAVRVTPLAHRPYRTISALLSSTTRTVPAAAALLDQLERAATSLPVEPEA